MNDSMSLYAPPIQDNAAKVPVDAARQAGSRTVSTGYAVVLLSLVVFVVSLFLPVVKINIFSTTTIEGYTALLMSFPIAAKNLLSVWPVLAFGNVWLVALPLLLRSRREGLAWKAAIVSFITTACAASLPFMKDGSSKASDDLLAGYYTWVASFCIAAIGAAWVAVERRSARRLEQALAA